MRLVVKAAALAAGATGLFSRVQTPVAAGRSFSTSPSQHQASSPVWKLGRLNHVAIAVPDLEKASSFYRDVLGAQVSEAVPLPEHGVSVVFVNLGNTKMELLHPLGSDSPIAGFLQKNKAGGMHHVCIEDKHTMAGAKNTRKGANCCPTVFFKGIAIMARDLPLRPAY
ncbi:methylmalonyl CoA epimerase (predicted), isoform CRA_c [Rattus norvegicus]|uniref:Methylmalonyl CoA epimerase (Predicted), isoform CRA_c n=1 Tax=Rattus norvegicus TaxID=10116 RepID=A6JBL6_RAT|nr:methylmalonyl-CoA epimerase, mitochondrial isoform X3 [Rattus norvegicus]EDM08393.1 methylmalonyl CoA epimerase (predicted), isoform CRA_c [Rattus norvegicus]